MVRVHTAPSTLSYGQQQQQRQQQRQRRPYGGGRQFGHRGLWIQVRFVATQGQGLQNVHRPKIE